MKKTVMKPKPTKKQPAQKQTKKKPVNIGLLRNLEDSLQDAEAFRVLASLAPVGIYLTKPDGTCSYANAAWCKIAGLRLEKAVGLGWVKGLHPDDRNSVFANWQKMVDSRGQWGMEYRFRTSAGKVTTVYGLATPQYDASGKIVGYVGVNIDITERKLAEAELRDSEQRLRTILQTAMDGFWLTDLQGRFLQVNDAYCRMIGYSRKELLAMRVSDVEAVESRKATAAHIKKVIAKGEDRFESRHKCKDGSIIDVEISSQYQPLDGGRFVVFVRDITETVGKESLLRKSELKYRTLIENTSDVISCVNEKGAYEFVNTVFATTFGKTPDYFVGKTFWDVYPKDHADYRFKATAKVFQTGEDESLDVAVPLPDKTLYYHAITTPIRDATGKVILSLTRATDITERKKAEAEIKTKNTELERFLYAASHDLKTPVVTIQSFIRYLKDDLVEGDTDRIEKDLKFISSSADKMVHLLDDLLEMSRVGRLIGASSHVTVKDLVADIVNTVAGRIVDRGITVKVADMDVSLYGDRPRLAEIWQNLIENACKFMGEEKNPRIDIGLEQQDKETVFFVRDNGIGIDPKYHDRIFDLFERLDKHIEGTGMGLAIVKRIVDLYQGRIWVESTGAGQGTTFCFTLPGAIKTEGKA